MKKGIFILTLALLLSLLALPVQAAAGDPAYAYELTIDGRDTLEVSQGDVVTVSLRLRRTDAREPSAIHGMQAELRYDADFLELVPGGGVAYAGVSTRDIGLVDNHREYYMNFLSMTGGTTWEAETLVGTLQFRVIGSSGVTKITNEDFLVSLPDGSGSYDCVSNELLLILSTDCTVIFQTNGGTPVENQTVYFGEKIIRPEDPVRAGYRLAGWYRDIHLTEEWDFDSDTVEGNMTLYAKWEPGDPVQERGGGWLWWLLLIPVVFFILFWLRRKKKDEEKK